QAQARPVARQILQPRAADLGATLDIERAQDFAKLNVIARLETLGGEIARLPDMLQNVKDVLVSGRRLRRGGIGERLHQRDEVITGEFLSGLGLFNLVT